MAIEQDRVCNIGDEILRYLAQRPNAADTIEGIKRWWLPRIRLDSAASDIERALNHLVRSGKVLASELPDGSTVYRNASP
jgi:hypothetical protein